MAQLCRMAVIDNNFSRARNLILHLKHLNVKEIEYFSSQTDCYTSISNSPEKRHSNVVFLYTDSQNSAESLNFVTKIMGNHDLSHIQIYIVSETYKDDYLIQLLRHGAIGHLHFPISIENVSQILNKATKIRYKIG